MRNDGARFDDVQPLVDEAERWLRHALDFGATAERLSLLGGFHKRCATMVEGPERIEHLRLAIESYANAQRLADDGYQRNNWVQLYHLLRMLNVDSDPAWVNQWSVSAEVVVTGPNDPPALEPLRARGRQPGPPRSTGRAPMAALRAWATAC